MYLSRYVCRNPTVRWFESQKRQTCRFEPNAYAQTCFLNQFSHNRQAKWHGLRRHCTIVQCCFCSRASYTPSSTQQAQRELVLKSMLTTTASGFSIPLHNASQQHRILERSLVNLRCRTSCSACHCQSAHFRAHRSQDPDKAKSRRHPNCRDSEGLLSAFPFGCY